MLPVFPKTLALASIILTLIVKLSSGNNGAGSGSDSNNNLQGSYDFVIVGGGTSGCVLANRLSEKFTVLVLEEGGLPVEEFDIPAKVYPPLYATSPVVKHYKTVPQQNAGLGTNNGRMDFMIGKVMGGTSQINSMSFNRGSPHDYDNWEKLTGDPSWKYENLLKYFKRIEDYQGNFTENGDQHGQGGPITVSQPKYSPGLKAFMEAGEYFEYPSWKDPNGPQIPSFTPLEYNKLRGRRVGAFTGYIKPILESRPKLTIITGARVQRIIFDSSNKRAIGVTFSPTQKDNSAGEINYVGARKEVIISAGAMDSPAILMRSGIGPRDVLEATNIPAIKILPVGYNLQNHVYLLVDFLLNRNTTAGLFIRAIDLNPETWRLYEETGDGPYSSLEGTHSQALWVSSLRLKEVWPNPEWADVKLQHYQIAKNFKPEDKLVNVYTRVILGRPKSKGRVTLNSSDVDATPLIDFQYLTDPEGHDLQMLLEAVKLNVKIYENAPSFKEQGCRLKDKQDVNCDGGDLEFGSDEYWKCVIRYKASANFHAGGTCRMGRRDDQEAVVDTRLKVIGVEGLRVADLSAAPQITNANTQTVAYVVAEKAADMIKEDWFEECNMDNMNEGGGQGD